MKDCPGWAHNAYWVDQTSSHAVVAIILERQHDCISLKKSVGNNTQPAQEFHEKFLSSYGVDDLWEHMIETAN